MLNLNELKSGFHYFVMAGISSHKRFAFGLLLSNCSIPFLLCGLFGFLLAKSVLLIG